MGAKVKRRSLTGDEHTKRLRFDAAHRDDPRRDELWMDLTKARGKGARSRHLFVVVRLRENLDRIGKWLVTDLQDPTWVPQPWRSAAYPTWISANAWCDLVFDTALPPCEREGKCPHPVPVYVEESENNKTPLGRQAMKRLRKLAGRQPKTSLGQ